MTKKTNSLILRYGISTLWKNKSINQNSGIEILRLENIIYSEFKKKKLVVFKIYIKLKTIVILVYTLTSFDLQLRKHVIKYYKKVLNLQKVVQKFGISDYYIINFLHSVGVKQVKLSNKLILGNVKMLKILISKKYYVQYLIKSLKYWLSFLNFLKQVYIKNMLTFFVEKSFSNIVCVHKKRVVKGLKLKKISGFLTYKLFSISIENIIYRLLGNVYNISINNILLFGGYIVDMQQNIKFMNSNFRLIFYVIMLASWYNNSKIVSDYISISIKTNKNHFKILKNFTDVIAFYFLRNILPLKGIVIRVSGKLGGKMRKSKYHYKIGKAELQTLKYSLSYNMSLSFTKFGILSIKVWLINGISYL